MLYKLVGLVAILSLDYGVIWLDFFAVLLLVFAKVYFIGVVDVRFREELEPFPALPIAPPP